LLYEPEQPNMAIVSPADIASEPAAGAVASDDEKDSSLTNKPVSENDVEVVLEDEWLNPPAEDKPSETVSTMSDEDKEEDVYAADEKPPAADEDFFAPDEEEPEVSSAQPLRAKPEAPETADEKPPGDSGLKQRLVPLFGSQIKVDTYGDPTIGSPDAEFVIAKLFDYTCPHCRSTHVYLEQARRRYGNRLAVVMLPVPMNTRCNRHVTGDNPKHVDACQYARFALAVYNADPTKFEEFHRYLMEKYDSTTLKRARDKAEQLVGQERFNQAMRDPLLEQQIETNTDIYNRVRRGKIPKLIYAEAASDDAPQSAKALFEFLENTVGLSTR
jgi:hypothetical protein